MRGELATNGRQQVNVHYVNSPVICVVEENSGRYYQNQGTVNQSLERNSRTNLPRTSSSSNSSADQDFGQRKKEGNSSETMNVEIQLEVDEALARELQEMENQFASTSVGEAAGTASGKDDD